MSEFRRIWCEKTRMVMLFDNEELDAVVNTDHDCDRRTSRQTSATEYAVICNCNSAARYSFLKAYISVEIIKLRY